MFGSLLRSAPVTKEINWNDTILLASQASNDNDPIQKEFVSLVKEAKILYSKQKKRKKLFWSVKQADLSPEIFLRNSKIENYFE